MAEASGIDRVRIWSGFDRPPMFLGDLVTAFVAVYMHESLH